MPHEVIILLVPFIIYPVQELRGRGAAIPLKTGDFQVGLPLANG